MERESIPAEWHQGQAPAPASARQADAMSVRSGASASKACRARGLTKIYGQGDTQVLALKDVSVDIETDRFTAIMGPSGSGKSTLMHCLAGLDSITSGEIFLGDISLTGLSDTALTKLRRQYIGFVFQSFNLVPALTALENITLPLDIAGTKIDREWLDTIVDVLALRPRLKHRPAELSGGQQQRVACARAMISRPKVIFADEPTGNLDSRSGAELLGLLRRGVDEYGQTIVMVTHDPTAAATADRVLFLADGKVVDQMYDPTADRVLRRMIAFEAPVGAGGAGGTEAPTATGFEPLADTPETLRKF